MPLAALRVSLLVLWLMVCAPPHLLSRSFTGRSRWPRRFLAGVSRIIGVRLHVDGQPAAAPALLVSNHRSWLDIPVLAAATGAAFVAKAELRHHWLLNWLCEQNGTLFIDRGDRRGVGTQAAEVEAALRRHRPLVLFAEGTVSPTAELLPFRPPLLAAVAPAPDGVMVRPVAVDYGTALGDIAWTVGETGVANFRKVMGRRGRIDATVHLLAPLAPSNDRKALARDAQAAVARALALSCHGAVAYRDGQ